MGMVLAIPPPVGVDTQILATSCPHPVPAALPVDSVVATASSDAVVAADPAGDVVGSLVTEQPIVAAAPVDALDALYAVESGSPRDAGRQIHIERLVHGTE
jgi:hypothetical protein